MRASPSPSWKLSPSRTTTRGIERGDLGGQAAERVGGVVGRQELARARRRPSPFSRCRSATTSVRARLQPKRAGGAQQDARPRPALRPRRRIGCVRRRSARSCASPRRSRSRPRQRGSSRARRARRALPADLQVIIGTENGDRWSRRLMTDAALDRAPAAGRGGRRRPAPWPRRRARAAQQQMVGLVAAQHVVDQVGGEADLAARSSGRRRKRRSIRPRISAQALKAPLHHRALEQPGFEVVAQHVLGEQLGQVEPVHRLQRPDGQRVVVADEAQRADAQRAPGAGSAAWPGWCARAGPRTDRRPGSAAGRCGKVSSSISSVAGMAERSRCSSSHSRMSSRQHAPVALVAHQLAHAAGQEGGERELRAAPGRHLGRLAGRRLAPARRSR